MSLTRWMGWIGRTVRNAGLAHGPARARLGVEPLGDRLAPSAGPFWFGAVGFGADFRVGRVLGSERSSGTGGGPCAAPGDSTTDSVVTHFDVRAVESPYTGVPTRLVVTAQNAANRPVSGYTGTVHLSSTDAATTLPADYTFTTDDRGRHVFEITPGATGTETITATDPANSAMTGSVTLTVADAPTATHFAVFASPRAGVGSQTQFAVVALDASNRPVRNYTGTVHFTSTDASAKLPAHYTFTADDRGAHRFTATFATAGTQTLTATDTASASLAGSAALNVGATGGNAGYGPWFGFGHRGGRWTR
jgi:hypothetical protein